MYANQIKRRRGKKIKNYSYISLSLIIFIAPFSRAYGEEEKEINTGDTNKIAAGSYAWR